MRKVSDHLKQAYGLSVAPVTIYGWIARFAPKSAGWMDSLGPRTGEKWHVDETVVTSAGDPRWVWNVLDADTRFLLATHVTKLRRVRDAKVPITRAKGNTPDRPVVVFSDGLPAYRKAIGRELAFRSGADVVNPHVRVRSIRAKKSNNRVERLHGTEKERVKVMRGFDNERGTGALMEGFRAHYNLIRDHQSLGRTPGAAAGIAPLTGFRWHELLKRAAPQPKAGYPEIELVPN